MPMLSFLVHLLYRYLYLIYLLTPIILVIFAMWLVVQLWRLKIAQSR